MMTGPKSEPKKPGRRVTRPRRGTLVMIAGLLIGSATIRLGLDAGQAIARQVSEPLVPAGSGAHAALSEPRDCAPPPDIAAMLSAFQDREARLNERESQFRVRMQALSVVDREITARMTALEQAEDELRATLALADAAAEKDLAKLTSVYESMKPKDAAALFEEMDPSFSAGFLGRMRPEAAAAVMAGLSPKTAYTVSALLAGRNADVPRE